MGINFFYFIQDMVGYNDGFVSFGNLLQGVMDFGYVLRVEFVGRFIKNKYFWIVDYGGGYSQVLFYIQRVGVEFGSMLFVEIDQF